MDDIRPRHAEYEAYVQQHKDDEMPFTDYDTWYKHELECEKQIKVEKRPKPSVSEQTKAMRLQGDLVSLKNRFYDHLAEIIWSKKDRDKTWKQRQYELDKCLNKMRKEIWERIEESDLQ